MDDTLKPKGWRQTLAVYFQLPMLITFGLGMASGFPLLLTGSTLATRMTESGVDIKLIGVFALVGLPYTLKFLWAPFVDAIKLGKTDLAHRRRWLWLTQGALAASLLGMALCQPESQIFLLAVLALAVALFSATQDIVIDALRVEMLPQADQGAGAAMSVSGYRVGMLFAGAGALLAATYLPWTVVYIFAAAFMLLCMPLALAIRRLAGLEEKCKKSEAESLIVDGALRAEFENDKGRTPKDKAKIGQDMGLFYRVILAPLLNAVLAPLLDFIRSYGRGAIPILLFILLFKLGDAMASSLSMPFYLAMGFSKPEIVAVTKVLGIGAIFLGTFLGGFVVKQLSLWRALLLCGTVQLLSNFVFVWLAHAGHSMPALVVAICVENITGGMGTAAFVAYMASLCNIKFTATQYALFSALSSCGRTIFASTSGVLVEQLGWSGFYIATAVFAMPGMGLLMLLRSRTDQKSGETTQKTSAA